MHIEHVPIVFLGLHGHRGWKAGYITSTKKRTENQRHGRIATFADHNLTASEESDLIRYRKFLRKRETHR